MSNNVPLGALKCHTSFFYHDRSRKNILFVRQGVKSIVENHILQVTENDTKLNFGISLAQNHIWPTSIC